MTAARSPIRGALPPETRFQNPRLSRVGLEPISLAELRSRDAGRGMVGRIERAQFFMLLVIREGRGKHLIDFRALPLRPGTVVVVRPGEIQQWQLAPGLEGDAVLVDPAVLQPSGPRAAGPAWRHLQLEEWPASFTLSADERADWDRLIAVLRGELDQARIDDLAVTFAREWFVLLLLWLSRRACVGVEPATTSGLTVRRFRRILEEILFSRPTVEQLAQRTGVSISTLSRACHATTGRPAKAVVDQRIALEAQRLLVHSEVSAVAIGERLGFSEATNFLKFFKRQVGETPERFRQRYRG